MSKDDQSLLSAIEQSRAFFSEHNEAHIRQMQRAANPVKWMYERLGAYIKHFEADLDEEHEIGARLVSFGQSVVFHIEHVGYHGPDIISFRGVNESGEAVQLIQHMSQLSVLLVAMKKRRDKPCRIGFIWDEK